jgi:transcriptional regulator with XRE-family HTH domain
MESETSFGALISRRRKALGLLQKELALQVGCSVAGLQKIERDERRPSRAMAERLRANLEDDLTAEQIDRIRARALRDGGCARLKGTIGFQLLFERILNILSAPSQARTCYYRTYAVGGFCLRQSGTFFC